MLKSGPQLQRGRHFHQEINQMILTEFKTQTIKRNFVLLCFFMPDTCGNRISVLVHLSSFWIVEHGKSTQNGQDQDMNLLPTIEPHMWPYLSLVHLFIGGLTNLNLQPMLPATKDSRNTNFCPSSRGSAFGLSPNGPIESGPLKGTLCKFLCIIKMLYIMLGVRC